MPLNPTQLKKTGVEMSKTDFNPDIFSEEILGIITVTRARQDYQQLHDIYDSLAEALMVDPEDINERLEDIEGSLAAADHALSEIDVANWRINSEIIEGYYPSIRLEVLHDGDIVFQTQLDHSTAKVMMDKRQRERMR